MELRTFITTCDKNGLYTAGVWPHETPLTLPQHTKTFVANDEFHPIQTLTAKILEEADSAGFVLFHTLSGAQNLTITVLIERNRPQIIYNY